MKGFPDLQEAQTLFWRLLTAPEGAARGCEALVREGVLRDRDLGFFLRPGERLSPTERLDVYADMYFYRLKDCLAEDYPNLAAWIGPARFHNLVTDYLLAHPSRHPSLRELGRALPVFLESQPLPARFACAPDLARLEWARLDVFDDADATPLAREALLRPGAAAPEDCMLALVPALRLLQLERGVLALWRALADGNHTAERASGPASPRQAVCVWRRGFTIFHRSLAADEERCLRAFTGKPLSLARLGELVLEGQADDVEPGAPAARFAELLERWMADGLFCTA
jgi:hypothetical protein